MKLLVTGDSGFLGRALVPILESAMPPRGDAQISWSRVVHGDVLSHDDRQRVLEAVQPDAVIHLAWLKTGGSAYEFDTANYLWADETVAFAREVVGKGLRFIGIGSMIEDDIAVNSPYAVAKRSAAEGVLTAGLSTGLSTWLRPSWIFDFSELRPRLLREAAESASAGVPFVPRNPKAHCDFIHVNDVAGAIWWALDRQFQGSADINSGRSTSVSALLRAYDFWRGNPARARPLPVFPADLDRLGWEPRQTVEILGPFWAESDVGVCARNGFEGD